MCRFKSGIILKNRVVVSQDSNDSHSHLLEQLNIADTSENAITKFVRAELVPPNNEWWSNPDSWEFVVDQDIVPEWFEKDTEKYKQNFITAVREWCSEHILIDKVIDELTSGYYMLKRSKVKKLLNDVKVMCDSSTVEEMYGSSTVKEMYDSSTVERMYDSSTVERMCGSSTVKVMCGSSTVKVMYGSSTVKEMYDSSTVEEMYGSSTVKVMCGSSTVKEMYDSSTVERMCGSSTVKVMCGSSTVERMCGISTVKVMYGSSIARDIGNKKIMISNECDYEIIKK